jgi:hypothetical protein
MESIYKIHPPFILGIFCQPTHSKMQILLLSYAFGLSIPRFALKMQIEKGQNDIWAAVGF